MGRIRMDAYIQYLNALTKVTEWSKYAPALQIIAQRPLSTWMQNSTRLTTEAVLERSDTPIHPSQGRT